MKQLLIVLLVLASALLQVGCSNDVTGSWEQTKIEGKSTYSVVFTKDGKGILSSGDIVTYAVDGDKIIIGSWAGGANGTISGKTMIFPEARGVVSGTFAGKWTKQ